MKTLPTKFLRSKEDIKFEENRKHAETQNSMSRAQRFLWNPIELHGCHAATAAEPICPMYEFETNAFNNSSIFVN